jgi:hypothetical protein
MTMSKKILAAALVFGCSTASAAFATDLPYGGDALYHQLQASGDVAIARLTGRHPGILEFTLLESLEGSLPLDFTVDANEPGLSSLRVGGAYLLFLNASRDSGVQFQLATSYYSIRNVRGQDRRAYRTAVDTYLRNVSDKASLKPELRRLAASRLPYLQYSAVVDLERLHLLGGADVTWLAGLLSRGQLADPSARGIAVQQIGRFRAREFTGLLENVVRDNHESVSVRANAFRTLEQLGATESLRALAPVVERSPALHYKTHARERLEAERRLRSAQP